LISVKAIFYALFFGRERYSEGDCAAFVACFVTPEERTRVLIDEDGNEYEETYEVLVPIKSLPAIYANIAAAFDVEISNEDQINASEIYYRIMYGGPVPSYGSGFDQWLDGLPLSDGPFIGADGFCSPLGENWRRKTEEYEVRLRTAKTEYARMTKELARLDAMIMDAMDGHCIFSPQDLQRRMQATKTSLPQNL